jgi:spore coat protein U-like protein
VTYSNSTGLSISLNNYAKILSSGASIPPGTYTDSYTTGAQAVIASDGNPTGTVAAECTGNNSSSNWWNTTAFTVSVTLQASCSVSASPLSFGTAGPLTANIDATTNLSITCTYTTPYSVALSAGNAPGATTSTRAMTNGSGEVFYSLYQNSARTLNWGSNLGVDTVAGSGTGSPQTLAVFGRTPPQTTPAVGDYSDSIIVTVSY